MATSLYDLSVPTFLQTVTALAGVLDRAAAHCARTGADPDDFVEARLFADMAPFHFQIEAAWHHAVWGVEALRTGAFTPPALVGPVPFAALRAIIAEFQMDGGALDSAGAEVCLMYALGEITFARAGATSAFKAKWMRARDTADARHRAGGARWAADESEGGAAPARSAPERKGADAGDPISRG